MSDPDYAAMAECIERLNETSAELRALAETGDVPAVERNAKRVEAAVSVLELNVPPELIDAETEPEDSEA